MEAIGLVNLESLEKVVVSVDDLVILMNAVKGLKKDHNSMKLRLGVALQDADTLRTKLLAQALKEAPCPPALRTYA